jgi:hypothetical protein
MLSQPTAVLVRGFSKLLNQCPDIYSVEFSTNGLTNAGTSC